MFRGLAFSLALLVCSACSSALLPKGARPRTPVEVFIVAVHDYTALSEGVGLYIELVTTGIAAGQAIAFRQMRTAEILASISNEGAIVIRKLDSQLRECTGQTSAEIGGTVVKVLASRVGLESCENLTLEILVATGELRGTIARLKPRLEAAQGDI